MMDASLLSAAACFILATPGLRPPPLASIPAPLGRSRLPNNMRLALSVFLLCCAANAFVVPSRHEIRNGGIIIGIGRTSTPTTGDVALSSETSSSGSGSGDPIVDDVMGDLPERKYVPKEDDNASGGSRFKMMMKTAQQRKEEGYQPPQPQAQQQAQPQQQQYQQYQAQPQPYVPPVPVQPGPPLPPNWASAVDVATGMTYYYNSQIGAVQWEFPQMIPPPPAQPTQPSQQQQQVVEQVQPKTEPISEPEAEPESQPTSAAQQPDEEFKPVPIELETKSDVTSEQAAELRAAVEQMDTSLLEDGLEMDEETTDAAFWAVVDAVDTAEKEDKPLSAHVPRMLHHIFDADLKHLLTREQLRMNVTCMQPKDEGLTSAHQMNYIFDDSSHKDLPLTEGRRCEDGHCCDACSRNIYPTFASDAETSFDTFPELVSLTFNELETMPAATILQFARLVERVRRTIAHEYGLPLQSILPLQAYSRKYVAGATQQGGGGGEGDFVTLHTDEATHAGYHFSCVLYLSTQGEDFEGGNFIFNDPDPNYKKKSSSIDDEDEEDYDEPDTYLSLEEAIRREGRKFIPFQPTRGAAVIFSSGWENMHEVERITEGTRYCVPAFFTTSPVPEQAYEQMAQGKPKTDEDIADDWLHLLLAHREESPLEAAGRVKELLMKWHMMCAPLSEH